MKWIITIFCIFCIFHAAVTLSTRRIPSIDFYEEAKQENLSNEELELLKPIIDTLNTQYEYISTAELEKIDTSIENKIKDLCLEILESDSFEDDFLNEPFTYNISLPSLDIFKESHMKGESIEEIRDMEQILEESIDDAQRTLLDIVERSNEIEAMLISIDKKKILKYIVKMLGNVFSIGVRLSRTAYCTYSNIPLINSTISDGKANIGFCYIQTRNSIKELRTSVQASIDTIRRNVLEIIEIYKKIASRESLLGKLLTLVMNASKLQNDVNESRESAYRTINQFKTEVPVTIATVKECAAYTIPNFVQQLNETVTTLTTCYNFVDDSTVGPEPEPESQESWETDI